MSCINQGVLKACDYVPLTQEACLIDVGSTSIVHLTPIIVLWRRQRLAPAATALSCSGVIPTFSQGLELISYLTRPIAVASCLGVDWGCLLLEVLRWLRLSARLV